MSLQRRPGNIDEIERTRAGLNAVSTGAVIYNGADMTRRDEIEALVRTAESRFGSMDVRVSDAGIQHVGFVRAIGKRAERVRARRCYRAKR